MLVTSHVSDGEMNSFYSGVLSAADMIAIAEHLEVCSDCKNQYALFCDKLGRAATLYDAGFLIGSHLEYEELSSYLEKRLHFDDAQAAKAHLAMCAQCRGDLVDLRRFRSEIDASGDSKGLFVRVKEFFKNFGHLRSLPAYATLIVILAIGALAVWAYLSIEKVDSLPRQVNEPKTGDGSANHLTNATPSPSITPVEAIDRRRRSAAPLVIEVADNNLRYGLDRKGNLVGLSDLSSKMREEVKNALSGNIPEIPKEIEELGIAEANVRGEEGDGETVSLISPLGAAVLDDRPVLRWRPVNGAAGYVVNIVDESFNPVAQSEKLSGTEWRVAKPLERGAIYVWQVNVVRPDEKESDRPAQMGKFKVIGRDRLREVIKARNSYRSRLALGIFYLKEGLKDEAQAEFRKLLEENPQDDRLARLVNNILKER